MTQPVCSSQDQSSPRSLIPPRKSVANFHRRRGRSVFNLLVQREMSPKAKFVPRKRWGKSRWYTDPSCKSDIEPMKDAGQSLVSWVEAESLNYLSSKYCALGPPPRSTIAAAFSSDGKTIASTHGDHTVKIIDCETGNCLKVLSGHRRTPWVVRFHPQHSDIVASGSLDQDVRLWNTTTSQCITSYEFYRPIASIAFHAEGELLAVASGHKLHMWHYNRRGGESPPVVVLKTRRSLRAVHFHPHGAPFLLTAEVNEMDTLDSSMSRATSMGYLRYPPPSIFFTSPESNRATPSAEDPRIGQVSNTRPQSRLQNILRSAVNANRTLFPPSGPNSVRPRNSPSNTFVTRTGDTTSPAADAMNVDLPELRQTQQLFQLSDRVSWELPFLQGWLMAQAQGHGVVAPPPPSGVSAPNAGASTSRLETTSLEAAVASLEIPGAVVPGRGDPQ
ncbi:unnamed protein product [Microthlaspi erraticum]|uniref:Uncharacterized protein n=1 Tax=Microthlaspi erraticum TaxID=1685480 RepID=A0A6D2I4L6_9BRAS|nr:unnamed protein product [Microthlaspi erraticum]